MITRQQKQIISFILLLVVMVLPMLAMADDGGTPDTGGELDPAVPIDGGLSLLVAAGVGYGAKKMKERKSKIITRNK